jgi:hypothetical protein
MRTAIVDLDQSAQRSFDQRRDRGAIAALLLATGAFALVVWIARPAAAPVPSSAASAPDPAVLASLSVPRGTVLHPLELPPGHATVDLAALPERLANEAIPWTLRRVVRVRGSDGVASVEGPAQLMWTEGAILYWLRSSDGTTADLIRIADELR